MTDTSLTRKALSGIGWTTLDRWGRTGITLLVFIILARLLDPVAFGLVALANVYLAFCTLFSEQGFSVAIIQREDLSPDHLDTAFWTSIAIGLILVLATVFLAAPVSALFGEPRLRPIMVALSINLLASALSSVQISILKRDFRFRSLAMRNVIATTAGGGVGVTMALAGYGVWSLVAMSIATSIVALGVLWSAASWRPSLNFSVPRYRELFRFGSSVAGTNVVKFLGKNADRLLIGLFISTEALGVYKIAYNLVHQVSSAMSSIYSVVALPVLSRVQFDRARLNELFSKFTRISLITAAPLFAILMIHADALVPALFGQQWLESVPILRILALLGALHAVTYFHEPMLYALGKPGAYLGLNIGATATKTGLILVAAPFGLVPVAMAVTAAAFLQWPWTIAVISRHSALRLRPYSRSLLHALMPTLCMSAVLLSIVQSGATNGAHGKVVVAIAIAGFLNVCILWFTDRPFVLAVLRVVRRRILLRPA